MSNIIDEKKGVWKTIKCKSACVLNIYLISRSSIRKAWDKVHWNPTICSLFWMNVLVGVLHCIGYVKRLTNYVVNWFGTVKHEELRKSWEKLVSDLSIIRWKFWDHLLIHCIGFSDYNDTIIWYSYIVSKHFSLWGGKTHHME